MCMSSGQQIKLLRTSLNLTRKQLAEAVGVDQQIIINAESYNIQKHADKLLKYLLQYQSEAIANLTAMTEAIRNMQVNC